MASPTHRVAVDSGMRDHDARMPSRVEVTDSIREKTRGIPAVDGQGRLIPAAPPPPPPGDPAGELAAARRELADAQAALAAAKTGASS